MNLDEMRKRAEEGAALVEKATRAPWVKRGRHVLTLDEEAAIAECGGSGLAKNPINAAFVADARTRVPALAADVLALLAENERLTKERDEALLKARIIEDGAAEMSVEIERLRAALNRPRKGVLGEACEPAKSAISIAPAADGC